MIPLQVMGLQDKLKVPEGMESQIEKGQEHGMKVMEAFGNVKTDLMPEVETGQEDCLYMNVYAPEFKKGDKLKPVIVFIHDGFFFIGGITKRKFETDKSVLVPGSGLISLNLF
jgi:carboxylesterase type B